MSSVPMASNGAAAELSLIGCNNSTSDAPQQRQADHAASSSLPPQHNSHCTPPASITSHLNALPSERSREESSHEPTKLDERKVRFSTNRVKRPDCSTETVGSSQADLQLHRIREVRTQQGVSVRSMARRMGIDVRSYRRLEDPKTDLTLTELCAVQAALEVPVADLLVDRQCLSRPVAERAKMVKAMKTAVAMRETKSTPRVERMANMLCEQLVELMPELQDVSGWPQFGARRGQNALGRALSQPIDTSHLNAPE